jgi:GDP-4-dehydro-6-deoxy-D-mannose reductase
MSINLLEIINSLNTKPTFVGIGSFAEYGNITKQVTEEDVESPTNFYGLSKLTVNKLSKIFCDRNNINWTWIRPCYVYGPNDVSTRIIPAVLNCLLNNKSVTLDSCDVTVDYLHIYDFCSAVYHITNKNLHGIYNVCSGKEYSLRNIIELLYTLTSQQNTPVFGSERYRTDSPTYVCGANNKLKLSGWVHNYELQDGIIDTINFHKNQRSIDDV